MAGHPEINGPNGHSLPCLPYVAACAPASVCLTPLSPGTRRFARLSAAPLPSLRASCLTFQWQRSPQPRHRRRRRMWTRAPSRPPPAATLLSPPPPPRWAPAPVPEAEVAGARGQRRGAVPRLGCRRAWTRTKPMRPLALTLIRTQRRQVLSGRRLQGRMARAGWRVQRHRRALGSGRRGRRRKPTRQRARTGGLAAAVGRRESEQRLLEGTRQQQAGGHPPQRGAAAAALPGLVTSTADRGQRTTERTHELQQQIPLLRH